MTTSDHQRDLNMPRHRISPDNPVRRRLFADDEDSEARIDNFANVLQESMVTESAQKMLKWNFDFKNDVPLEGDYEWYPSDDGRNDWIGVKRDTNIVDAKEDDSFLDMKIANEATPKSSKEEESAPLLRKRRPDLESSNDKGVKRKICFDKCN